MKRVSATEARANWFQLLDEVAKGEVFLVTRHGKRIVVKLEGSEPTAAVPDYSELLKPADLGAADEWGWDWSPADGVVPR